MNGLSLADYTVLLVVAWASIMSTLTLLDIRDTLEQAYIERNAAPIVREHKPTLPEICAPHYGKGNEDWITCMGVEYK